MKSAMGLKSKYFTAILFLLLVFIGARSLWYYPLYHKPPILEINANSPSAFSDIQISEDGHTLKRYFLILNDKEASFPGSDKTGWSEWSGLINIPFGGKPAWVKIFIEERWLVFRKRSSWCFYNAGNESKLFNNLMSFRYTEMNAKVKNRIKIAFLGDSLTCGLFCGNTGNGFAQVVHDKIGEQTELQSLGVSRIRMADFNQEKLLGFIKRPLDIVVVELGTNDFETTSVADFRKEYEKLVKGIRRVQPSVGLICLGLWQGYKSYKYDETILEVSVDYRGKYVYLADLFENKEMHSKAGIDSPWGKTDAFHPSDQGHAAIAERVLAVIENLKK